MACQQAHFSPLWRVDLTCNQVGWWLGCQYISDTAASPSMPRHVFVFPMMHLCVMCGCWSVNCFHVMLSFLFFLTETKGQIYYVLIFHLLTLSHSVNQPYFCLCLCYTMTITTVFQYTLAQIIISHQNCLSNALLRILHCNEMCLLRMNLPTPTPDFTRLPLEAGHTGSYYWHPQ